MVHILSPLLVLLVSSVSFGDQSPAGRWRGEIKLDTSKVEAQAKTKEEKDQFQKFSAGMKKNIADTKLELTINPGGTCSFYSKSQGQEKTDKGQWRIEEGKIRLIMAEAKNQDKVYLEWSKDQKKLILQYPKDPSGMDLKIEFTRLAN